MTKKHKDMLLVMTKVTGQHVDLLAVMTTIQPSLGSHNQSKTPRIAVEY